jgi:formamidopyrimidine-DNA glycosylase
MPELPEVETVARGLHPELSGRSIIAAAADWPRTIVYPPIDEFLARVAGRSIQSVGRRGKYVIIRLDQGHLLIHLKMSGRLQVTPSDDPLDKHTHTIFDLDDGRQLRFHDVRKFGRVYLVDTPETVTSKLGPEPLADELTLDAFRELLAPRSGRLKSLLLNQAFLAGLGNIYADEALFVARLHPLRKADTLTLDEEEALYGAIRLVLARAIAGRGTTLDDQGYRDASGQAGSFQEQIAVYGRTGAPCATCRNPIERIVVGGRSTHFCPRCQAA